MDNLIEETTPLLKPESNLRAGFVALLGVPNAGKSTLANVLIGEKFSIVTRKAQTTRRRHLGILNTSDSQIILMDAPGVVDSDKGLNTFIKDETSDILRSADGILVVLNLDEKDQERARAVIEKARASHKPWAVAVTKADLNLQRRTSIIRQMVNDDRIPVIAVSAHTAPVGSRELLLPVLKNLVPSSPSRLYDDEEMYTPQTLRELASEWIREKCFEFLHDEIPYGLAVSLRTFKEDEGAVVKIAADIVVEKENHKKMVIGKDGQTLKMVGVHSRQELEKLLGRQVFLELHVVVKEKWFKNSMMLKDLGYSIPKE